MKKAIIALAVTSVFALSACNSSSNSEVLVKTSAGNVTKEELYDAMKLRAGNSIVKELVVSKVFTKKYNVTDKEIEAELKSVKEQYGDQYDSLLKQSGMTEKDLKTQIKSNLALKKAVADSITDKDLQAKYKPEIRASHILVKDEATAKKVMDELKGGKSFEDLAKQYSEDTGSKDKGGDLGFFGPGKMVPEFEAAAYKLKKGEMTQEPVKSQYGYHIIKVTDIKELKPFNEVKDDLKKQLVDEKMADSTFVNTLIDKELKKADLKVEDKDLKSAFETKAASSGTSTNGQ
ncbi:peptidylprolyl isomerase PrsA [Ectobacillus ponti]|uniref:Foldase protein PrsA n=1 Tax=Ectobacillus ponti TaxID=2961894 RepID=A0AA41X8A9_9BACI|nr:peptidylprolyl isomerase PrsA [Ectobacillus ponti]MCP8968205.1 peptidylprolyl isomerase PrsA [Ectobacillus ponti]